MGIFRPPRCMLTMPSMGAILQLDNFRNYMRSRGAASIPGDDVLTKALGVAALRLKAWSEDKHPRATDGKFGSGGSASGNSSSQATLDSSTPDHAATVESWMSHEQNAHVAPEIREKIGKALHDTLKSMPAPMAAAAVARMSGPPKLYASLDHVTAEFAKRGEKVAADEQVSGFYSFAEKTIHIDHGVNNDHEDAVHIYAHELGHCLEPQGEYSRTPEWKAAWEDEIDRHGGPLSEYARENPSEGFAELIRAVVTQPDEAKRFFPKCHRFLEKQGLI